MRRVVISKKDASGAVRVIQRCRPHCGKQLQFVDRPSGNLCSTVGGKVQVSAKRIINVLGSSSFCASSSMIRGLRGRLTAGQISTMCKSVRFISNGSLNGYIHCCSSELFRHD